MSCLDCTWLCADHSAPLLRLSAAVWTKAVRNTLQLVNPSQPDLEVRAFEIVEAIRTNATTAALAKQLGLCIPGPNYFNTVNVRNMAGSNKWVGQGYVSWRAEREAFQQLQVNQQRMALQLTQEDISV